MSINDGLIEMKKRYEAQAPPEGRLGGVRVGHKHDLNRYGYMHSVQHNKERLASLLNSEQPSETTNNRQPYPATSTVTIDRDRRPEHGESSGTPHYYS